MLLPPGQRLAKDLPRLVHVEVSGTQETQYVLVLRDLDRKGSMLYWLCKQINEEIIKEQKLSQLSPHCQGHCKLVQLNGTPANRKSVSHISM